MTAVLNIATTDGQFYLDIEPETSDGMSSVQIPISLKQKLALEALNWDLE
jgi:hypothetical protein